MPTPRPYANSVVEKTGIGSLEVSAGQVNPLSRIALEDVIAAEHLRSAGHHGAAAPIVLDHIAFQKGMGTMTYAYPSSRTILNRVASQVADTCGCHNSRPRLRR